MMEEQTPEQPISNIEQSPAPKEPLVKATGWGIGSLGAAVLFFLILLVIFISVDSPSDISAVVCLPMFFLLAGGVVSAVIGIAGGDTEKELACLGLAIHILAVCGCLSLGIMFSDL
jgi:hypothetical protein